MLLAGDIGGTRARLGLFDLAHARRGAGSDRPRLRVVREFVTLDFESLDELVQTFLDETGGAAVDAACFGVAGPVTGLVARLTNVPWLVDAAPLADRLGGGPVDLVNDLEALASAVPVLEADELVMLQEGIAQPSGNAALIAAGTGLGEALLHNVDGRFIPAASEGGHADFAARTPREAALAEEITRWFGRVDNERILSGPGLVNVARFTHGTTDLVGMCRGVPRDVDAAELPAAVSTSALEGRCDACVEALEIFVEAYGAEAGNLALRSVATAGVYIGGGIAPRILPFLERGAFMDAFRDKEPMVDLLRTLPVAVIINPSAGLLGAAVRAAARLPSSPPS